MTPVPQPVISTPTTTLPTPAIPRPPCKGSHCKPATAACWGAKATKAACNTSIAGLTKELAALQRRYAGATGKKKSALKGEIAAVKQASAYCKAGLKTLKR
jgi:hypothetical protein